MEVIKSQSFKDMKIGPLVIALGTFDGIHLGHQKVIKLAEKISKEENIPSAVYTFFPHPLKVIKPAIAPDYLLSESQKIELISKLDIDYYLQQEFTSAFSQLDYRRFVEEYLIKGLQVKHIVVGEDFKLGSRGMGSIEKLRELAREFKFSITGIKNVEEHGNRVSSTLIRKLISLGKVKEVPEYLGRYYRLKGQVIHGFSRGKKIVGYPTANLKTAVNYVLPPRGVYACYVYYRAEKYKGIVNFGVNPTFSNDRYSIEVHIYNFNKNIYGEDLCIELVDFIRGEMTFASIKELSAQIKEDILYTARLLC
ncbi:MAG: bifunctional riboflavin kinase/FAD synthetase [Firmicutes bacterium]|nr:bifunctional riboflavin kinase/FAD synthetase [Bacillota bacterium]